MKYKLFIKLIVNLIITFSLFAYLGNIRNVHAQGNLAPELPILNSPENGQKDVSSPANLNITVNDLDSDDLTVEFYGKKIIRPEKNFSIVALGDSQYYSYIYPAVFDAQVNWILENKDSMNTKFVTHLGDLVQYGARNNFEWQNIAASLKKLDNQIPYGVALGGHDLDTLNNIYGLAEKFNEYFPASHFQGQNWYDGGNYSDNNKNSYQLFGEGALKYIIFHLEVNAPDDVLNWVKEILASDEYQDRKAIISTHIYLSDGFGLGRDNIKSFRIGGNSGENIWNELIKDETNVSTVLSSHFFTNGGENRQISQNNIGGDVDEICQNFQDRSSYQRRGDGFLRYYIFKPSENKISAYTYSPYLDKFETDNQSQFDLDYNFYPDAVFEKLGETLNVHSGSAASYNW